MPAFAPITVKDRESVPQDHVYSPKRQDPKTGAHRWTVLDGTPLGDQTLLISVSDRSPSGLYKIRIKLTDPIVVDQTINGVIVPTVDRTSYAVLELTYSERSTTLERANLVGKLANLLAPSQTLVNGVIVNLEGIYG